VSTNAIARRYAKALMQVAAERGVIEEYYGELSIFSDALSLSIETMAALVNPGYRLEAKRETIRTLAARLGISRMINDFLLLLLDKKRIEYLPQITACFRSFADEASGILRSTVTSALPLADAQVEGIRTSLEKATGKKIILNVATDPLLIGGVVTQIGDKVFDGSIKTQLTKIQHILQKG
jgi:F-type H+-transporting ATPase subunit delta